jgi:hypothetical protein
MRVFGWQGIELPTSFLLGLAAGRISIELEIQRVADAACRGTSALEMH